MIFIKDTTYGLETKIADIQKELQARLPWFKCVKTDDHIEIFGLIQRTRRRINNSDVFIPEVFRENGEYGELFVNDNVAATIGFYVTARDIEQQIPTATIDAIFTVDLEKIHGNTWRQSERAIIEARQAIEFIDQVTGIKENINRVFADFDQEMIKHRSMQPWFIFSLTFETTYKEVLCEQLV